MSLLILIGCLVSSQLLVPGGVVRADDRQDAHQHYEAGVLAFEQLRFADAAAEFELAYAQVPAWQVLYNLGAVYAALGRPIQAIEVFERYLQQADASVAPERRQDVQAEIAKQRAKTGVLEVGVNALRAEISVDGRSVGTSPLSDPIRVAAGSHVVEVSREGFRSQSQEAVVSAGRRTQLEVILSPELPDSVAIDTRAPELTATTPADPGSVHRIVGLSLGGAGLLGVAVGVVLAATGQGQHNDAVDLANRNQWPEAEALESASEWRKTVGFTTMAVGGTFLAGGIALFCWRLKSITALRACTCLAGRRRVQRAC